MDDCDASMVVVIDNDPARRADALLLVEAAGYDALGFDTLESGAGFISGRLGAVGAVVAELGQAADPSDQDAEQAESPRSQSAESSSTETGDPVRSETIGAVAALAARWPDIAFVVAWPGPDCGDAGLPRNLSAIRSPWLPLDVIAHVQRAAALQNV